MERRIKSDGDEARTASSLSLLAMTTAGKRR